MNELTDEQNRFLARYGFDEEQFRGWQSGVATGSMSKAGNAVTDEKARKKLLSDATDTALDFILRILPSMPVPPVDGVKDGLVYHISNLSMEGFKVKKENMGQNAGRK